MTDQCSDSLFNGDAGIPLAKTPGLGSSRARIRAQTPLPPRPARYGGMAARLLYVDELPWTLHPVDERRRLLGVIPTFACSARICHSERAGWR